MSRIMISKSWSLNSRKRGRQLIQNFPNKEEQKRHLREVKEGKRAKTDVSDQFDALVEKHVRADVELATEALKNSLSEEVDDMELD